jgi:hypothetical protein
MGDKPFLGLVVAFVPALGCIRVYKAKDFPRDLVAGLSLAAFCDSREHASFRSRGLVYAKNGTKIWPSLVQAVRRATSVRFCIVRRIRRGNHYLPRRMTCVAVVPARKTT